MTTVDNAYGNLQAAKAKLQQQLESLKVQQSDIQKQIMDTCLTMMGLDRALDTWEGYKTPTDNDVEDTMATTLDKEFSGAAA